MDFPFQLNAPFFHITLVTSTIIYLLPSCSACHYFIEAQAGNDQRNQNITQTTANFEHKMTVTRYRVARCPYMHKHMHVHIYCALCPSVSIFPREQCFNRACYYYLPWLEPMPWAISICFGTEGGII